MDLARPPLRRVLSTLMLGVGLLFTRVGVAAELPPLPQTPRAEAIRSPDGAFVLTLYPPLDWIAAEVEVKGGDGVDLGSAKTDQPVHVRGVSSRKGPLLVTLRIATPQKIGITWEFDVEPTAVPARAPDLIRGESKAKRRGRR